MSPEIYMRNAIKIVKSLVHEDGDEKRLRMMAKTPFSSNYRPELDVTAETTPEMASRFMQLIGILQWAVELGHLDIPRVVAVVSASGPPAGGPSRSYIWEKKTKDNV